MKEIVRTSVLLHVYVYKDGLKGKCEENDERQGGITQELWRWARVNLPSRQNLETHHYYIVFR